MPYCSLYNRQTDPEDHIICNRNRMGRRNTPMKSTEAMLPVKRTLPLKHKDLSKEQNHQIMKFEKDTLKEKWKLPIKVHILPGVNDKTVHKRLKELMFQLGFGYSKEYFRTQKNAKFQKSLCDPEKRTKKAQMPPNREISDKSLRPRKAHEKGPDASEARNAHTEAQMPPKREMRTLRPASKAQNFGQVSAIPKSARKRPKRLQSAKF